MTKSDKEWTSVGLTSLGNVVVQGTFLLPVGSSPIPQAVVEGNGRTKLLPTGVRSDPGTAAVVSGDLLAIFGGDKATVKYRKAEKIDVLRYKPMVKIQLLVALLTLVATVLSSINSFVGTRSPTTPVFSADAAPWVLGVAFVLAISNLYSSVKTDVS